MNATNKLPFRIYKKKQYNKQYDFQWQTKVEFPKSYYFLAEIHNVRIPQQNEKVNGMFALYQILLIEVNF